MMSGRSDRKVDLGDQHTTSTSLEQLPNDIYADAKR